MTERLFKGLRTVFGSRSDYNKQVETWAKTEYGRDWYFAYQQIMSTGKTPTKGIDY